MILNNFTISLQYEGKKFKDGECPIKHYRLNVYIYLQSLITNMTRNGCFKKRYKPTGTNEIIATKFRRVESRWMS